MSTTLTTGKVRFSYAHFFEPYAAKPNQEAKYSVCLLIDKKDTKTVEAVKAAIEEAKQEGIKSKWGGKLPKGLEMPLHDGDEKDGDGYEGCYYLNAKNTRKPIVVNRNNQAILDPEEVYSGCYGRASITFFPYDNTIKGVAVSLGPVQKLADGERLGGKGVTVEEAFGSAYEDDDEDCLD